MKHLNIEIKAKCNNHKKIRDFLRSHKAEFRGTDHQIDTYFKVNDGRLKLREGNIENHLIYYKRSNKKGPKQSDIILLDSTPGSPLKEILTRSCGILAVVDKKREIYFIENVKFHIDTVKKLGTFVEIEAIADVDGRGENVDVKRKKLLAQCEEYLRLFKIQPKDMISVSYSDMLLGK